MRTLRLTLPLVLIFAVSVNAQQPEPANQAPQPETPANTITRNVSLVVLDGVVLDKQGHVVTDLTKDEFHITEADTPQVIRNFEMPGAFIPSPEVTINSASDLEHLAPRSPVNIILLDEFNTRFEDMAFARYSLKKWLEAQPAKLDTPAILIAVSLEHFTVVQDYTQNKDELIDALNKHFVQYPWQAHDGAWTGERYVTAMLSLRRVAEAVIGHPGHKDMIWIGRGFPTLDHTRVSLDTGHHLNSALQRTVDELRDARVTLYTVDPAGVMIDPGKYGMAAKLYAPFGGDPDFQDLARSTGGRNLYGRNDVDAEIGTFVRDGASMYSIAYRSTNPDTDPSEFLKIKVTLDRAGLTFVTRNGYYPDRKPARPSHDGNVGRHLATEIADATTSNMAYDAVGFTVQSAPNDATALHFNLDAHGISWYYTEDSKPRFTRILIVATGFDRKGKPLVPTEKRLQFHAPASAAARGPLEIPIAFDMTLNPEPKAVRTRVVVRVEASGRMGTADLPMVPGSSASSSKAESTTAAPVSVSTATSDKTPEQP
jgi:VWFA-related protein